MSDTRQVTTDPQSTAFELFHPKIRQWIYDSRWGQLRDVQERAVRPILAGDRDVIVAAATASGKTEAAWFPICTTLLREDEDAAAPGVKAVYISPLKALINDQHQRLTGLCTRLDLAVHRWHGDVAASAKRQVVRQPDGILLITPESLESMFVNHGDAIARILGSLRYVIVDELHAFIGTERGAQLQSLLHRADLSAGRPVPRVALSATLGDFAAAQDFLRPGNGESVAVVCSDEDARELKMQLRGYVATDPRHAGAASHAHPAIRTDEQDDQAVESSHQVAIADHLYRALRGTDNLVFANRRAAVETYADLLARRCHEARVPVEFVPHHGNLSKEIREHVENRLKDRSTPVTAVCTSTLEMGIDIGSVKSIAQIGAPITVSSLRQRLGRSGRQDNEPAVLRIYISEHELTNHTPPADALRAELLQTIAMIELLLEKWYEPPDLGSLHLSTLIQQILSLTAQHGGVKPATLHRTLCGDGPFRHVDPDTFQALLRSMGEHHLLLQTSDGLLLPGAKGDRIVNHYTFYTAFQTPDEYRLVASGRTLGSLPIEHPVAPGMLLIFSGRRWKIVTVDTEHKVIDLAPSTGGKPPSFPGSGGQIADEVRRAMRQLYASDHVPAYLDQTAQNLLAEGRAAFHRFGHHRHAILDWGNDTLLFPWRGDKIMNTLAVVLANCGLEVGHDGVALTLRGTGPSHLHTLIQALADQDPPNPTDLAATVPAKATDKYDGYLNEPLLNLAYAARALDVPSAWETLQSLAALPTPNRDHSL